MHPATALTVTEDLGRPRLPVQGAHRHRRRPGPGPELDLGLEVTPVAFGPVLLRNDDGRVSRFPRALVRCRTDDGREGTGWIEWNQPGAPPIDTA